MIRRGGTALILTPPLAPPSSGTHTVRIRSALWDMPAAIRGTLRRGRAPRVAVARALAEVWLALEARVRGWVVVAVVRAAGVV